MNKKAIFYYGLWFSLDFTSFIIKFEGNSLTPAGLLPPTRNHTGGGGWPAQVLGG